jgi:hypothetical protein
MKILILYRTDKDETGRFVKVLKANLEKREHIVEAVSRNENLSLPSLTSSMDALKEFVIKKNQKENYDLIYTQDWSIAFPLVFPSKILFDKHYCLFHEVEERGAQSKIMQKIVGNLLGSHLLVKTEKLKNKFQKAVFSKDGLEVLTFKDK